MFRRSSMFPEARKHPWVSYPTDASEPGHWVWCGAVGQDSTQRALAPGHGIQPSPHFRLAPGHSQRSWSPRLGQVPSLRWEEEEVLFSQFWNGLFPTEAATVPTWDSCNQVAGEDLKGRQDSGQTPELSAVSRQSYCMPSASTRGAQEHQLSQQTWYPSLSLYPPPWTMTQSLLHRCTYKDNHVRTQWEDGCLHSREKPTQTMPWSQTSISVRELWGNKCLLFKLPSLHTFYGSLSWPRQCCGLRLHFLKQIPLNKGNNS